MSIELVEEIHDCVLSEGGRAHNDVAVPLGGVTAVLSSCLLSLYIDGDKPFNLYRVNTRIGCRAILEKVSYFTVPFRTKVG